MYTFPMLVRKVESTYKVNKKYDDSISYFVTINGKTRKVVAYDVNDWIYFVIRTDYQFDKESDFSRDLMYKALVCNDTRAETYFAISNQKIIDNQGKDVSKLTLIACSDNWKGVLKDEWLESSIHTNLFNLCSDLENKL